MVSGRSLILVFLATTAVIPHEAEAVEIKRLGDSGKLADAASAISIAGPSGRELLSAMRNGDGRLEVIHWSVDRAGTVSRLGSSTGREVVTATAIDHGYLPNIDATPYWASVVVTEGHEKVIVWRLSSEGPRRLAEQLGEATSSCDVATLSNAGSSSQTFFATLCQRSNDMSLELWSINATGMLTAGHVVVLPAGSSPQVAYAGDGDGFARIITAYRDIAGKLRVGLHAVTQLGVPSNLDSKVAREVLQVALSANRSGEARTVARLRDGSFTSIEWNLSNGHALVPRASDVRGKARSTRVGHLHGRFWGTAGRKPDGTLEVAAWTTMREASAGGGGIQDSVALEVMFTGKEARMFTAVTTVSGNLMLIAWRVGEPES